MAQMVLPFIIKCTSIITIPKNSAEMKTVAKQTKKADKKQL